jgi:hypothetical protein
MVLKKIFRRMYFFLKDFKIFLRGEEDEFAHNSSQCAAILLSDVKHPELYFYLEGNKNRAIKNLCELSDYMQAIPETTFVFHVSKEKNDFAQWVEEKVGDKILAQQMHKAPSQKRMAELVGLRVEWLKSRMEP